MKKDNIRTFIENFNVNIYPLKTGEFLTSYAHPITKKKFRQRFATRLEAQTYKKETEEKFKRRDVESYHSLNLEELLMLFLHENPKSDLRYNKKGIVIDLVETFGGFPIEDITMDSMKVWLDQIQRERNLVDLTMRGIKCQLDRFFKYLVEKDIISESPVTAIYYEKAVRSIRTKNLLTEKQVEELLQAIKEYSPGYLYPLIKTFAETGAKTMELTELTWNDVDLVSGYVTFPKTIASKERKLKISDELTNMLKMKKKTQGYVFLNYYGDQFTKNKIRRAVDEFKAREFYKGQWNPQDLRHSFAVNFLTKGGDLKKLQYLMGHSNVFDTKVLYGEVAKKKIAEAGPQVPSNGFEILI